MADWKEQLAQDLVSTGESNFGKETPEAMEAIANDIAKAIEDSGEGGGGGSSGGWKEAVDTETKERKEADSSLDSRITSLSESVDSNVNSLSRNINDEASRAKAAEKSNSDAISSHTSSTSNPHSVTAEQVGAYTKEQVDGFIRNWSGYVVIPFGQSKPAASEAQLGKIYLVQVSNDPEVKDQYEEWISDGTAWSLIGTMSIDLSPYDKIVDAQAREKAINDALTAHKNDAVSHITSDERTKWNGKQDAIADLDSIRSGAALGATALQSLPAHNHDDRYYTESEIDIKLSEKGTYSKPSGGIPKSDLASSVQTSLSKADTALQSFTETDPTVPSWAKQANKPTYTASEVGALTKTDADGYYQPKGSYATAEQGAKADTAVQPGLLAKVATSGSYNDLSNKPTIPAAITIDSAMSSTSTNPVQNKVVNSALSGKLGTTGTAYNSYAVKPRGKADFETAQDSWYQCVTGSTADFCAMVLMYDVTDFYDGTIVNQNSEHSLFFGDVSLVRRAGVPAMKYSQVGLHQGYNTSKILESNNDNCYPVVVKELYQRNTEWTTGAWTFGAVGTTATLSTSVTNVKYHSFSCSGVSTFYVNNGFYPTSLQGYKSWAFLNDSNTIISVCETFRYDGILQVPSGATKLVIQTYSSHTSGNASGPALSSPKYYLALRFIGWSAGTIEYYGRWYTRKTATDTFHARPLLLTAISENAFYRTSTIPCGYEIVATSTFVGHVTTSNKLATARSLGVNLARTAASTFDGSANQLEIPVKGSLPIANGGTGASTAIGAMGNLIRGMQDWTNVADGDFIPSADSSTAGKYTFIKVWNNYIKGKISSVLGIDENSASTWNAKQDALTFTTEDEITEILGGLE